MLSSFFGSVFWLIVTLGVLVTFHEFGHFWVARRCGVKVLRFSVGFGRALWKHTAKDGTEYQVAAIPLGGYVQMRDSRNKGAEPELDHDAAWMAEDFSSKSLPKRAAIVAAGPAFNILFTLVAFWAMFMLGARVIAPTVMPTPTGLAAHAGVVKGDRVVSVQGAAVGSYDETMDALATALMTHAPVSLGLVSENGRARSVVLPLDALPSGQGLNDGLVAIGLKPMPPAAIVKHVMEGKPAAAAGLKEGDRILTINGRAIADFEQLHDLLAEQASLNPRIHLTVQRGAQTLPYTLVARDESLDGQPKAWVIGIESMGATMVTQRYGVIRAAEASGHATWAATTQTVTMLGQMLTGRGSSKNVAGPIGIAQVANASAGLGIAPFLKFLALVSLSLGIANLLPIPVLDGGQLVFLFIEAVKGSPVSPRAMMIGQMVGIFLLVALMSLAMGNDVHRLLTS